LTNVMNLVRHLGRSFIKFQEGEHNRKNLIEDILLIQQIEDIKLHKFLKEPYDIKQQDIIEMITLFGALFFLILLVLVTSYF
jgi:hypothetical protein